MTNTLTLFDIPLDAFEVIGAFSDGKSLINLNCSSSFFYRTNHLTNQMIDRLSNFFSINLDSSNWNKLLFSLTGENLIKFYGELVDEIKHLLSLNEVQGVINSNNLISCLQHPSQTKIPEAKNHNEMSLLEYTAFRGLYRLLSLLLQKYSPLNNFELLISNLLYEATRNISNSESQFHLYKSRIPTIKMLLTMVGTKIDYSFTIQGSQRPSALISALYQKDFPVVKLLLKHGAELDAVSFDKLIHTMSARKVIGHLIDDIDNEIRKLKNKEYNDATIKVRDWDGSIYKILDENTLLSNQIEDKPEIDDLLNLQDHYKVILLDYPKPQKCCIS